MFVDLFLSSEKQFKNDINILQLGFGGDTKLELWAVGGCHHPPMYL